MTLTRVAALAACIAAAAPASAEPLHAIQIGLDMAAQSARDDMLAPVAFTGVRVALEPGYIGKLGPGLLSANAQVALGYVVDRVGERGATFTWGLRASYLPIVYASRWHLAVGPAFGWDNQTFAFVEWDDAHAYWIGTLWLGPGVRAWRSLRDGFRLDLGAELAALGWQSRTPSGWRPKQETSYDVVSSFLAPPTRHLRFGSLSDWQLVRASIEFSRPRMRSDVPRGWGVAGVLALVRAVDPALAFSFNASLRFSYTWSL